jgi:hypothetical protein
MLAIVLLVATATTPQQMQQKHIAQPFVEQHTEAALASPLVNNITNISRKTMPSSHHRSQRRDATRCTGYAHVAMSRSVHRGTRTYAGHPDDPGLISRTPPKPLRFVHRCSCTVLVLSTVWAFRLPSNGQNFKNMKEWCNKLISIEINLPALLCVEETEDRCCSHHQGWITLSRHVHQ